jgi:hypothetical protein
MKKQLVEVSRSYATDAPLSSIDQDRFDRASFAIAIAEGITATEDSSNIVIGIYGPWGDGKTTVLNFIEENLKGRNGIISMQFNPWRYQSEDVLLVNFFGALATQLGKSLAGVHEKLAKKWGFLLKPLPTFGNLLSDISTKLGEVSLEEFKRRIEEILQEKKTRLVVLMDDIDRLSLEEVQATFRLIKLSGSLRYITYVLAFDDKMVAAALKQRYISDEETGQGFLEKIVQVPLRLPKTPKEVLARFCRERIQKSIEPAGVTLDAKQTVRLDEYFSLFSELLQTPRQCKRLENSLTFALALLKGEVNPVDLILIETLRALTPKLYEAIRSNRDHFLGSGTLSKDEIDKRVIEPALSGTAFQAAQKIQELLKKLFPAMASARSPFAQLQRELYDYLADDQRVASEYYFERFFTYNVPPTEIRDSQIASILAGIGTRDEKETGIQLQEIIDSFVSAGPESLIAKLSLRRKLLEIDVSKSLAPALCSIGHNFESFVKGNFPFSHPSKAALLVRQLVLNAPPGTSDFSPIDQRKHTIQRMIELCPVEAHAILFLYACLVSIASQDQEQKSYLYVYLDFPDSVSGNPGPLISTDVFAALKQRIAEKIKKVHESGYLYDFKNREVSRDLVDVWIECSSPQELRDLFEKDINHDPRRAIAVVGWYIKDVHAVDVFTNKLYERIHDIANPSLLISSLSKDFRESLANESVQRHPRQEQLDVARAYSRLINKVEHQDASSEDQNQPPSAP